jgi:GTP cyclohydrolase I
MLERNVENDQYGNRSLPDHAKDIDRRGIPIERVGIKGLTYPIRVMDKTNQMQSTVAEIDAYVGLPADVRGTHMSRFVEIINGERTEITLRSLPSLLQSIQRKLESDSAHLQVRFQYFLEKAAPVSGALSLMNYPCEFNASLEHDAFMFTLVVTVPVTSLCPCSKAVSKYGAHNQRSHIKVHIQSHDFVWIEDVVQAVEKSASAPLYALLKRSDEKWVTEQAYENAKFVEDLVRDSLIQLKKLPGARHIRVLAENFESIHNHSAFAELIWNLDEEKAVDEPAVNINTQNAPKTQSTNMFGSWLKSQRTARKISQQVLAERLGTSASFLSRVESGEKRLSEALLAQLAGVMGMDPTAVQLRGGVVPSDLLHTITADPESFVRWAQKKNAS